MYSKKNPNGNPWWVVTSSRVGNEKKISIPVKGEKTINTTSVACSIKDFHDINRGVPMH